MSKHLGILVLHPSVKVTLEDLTALRAAGYIPLQARNEQVSLRTPITKLDGGMLTLAAIKTVALNDQRRQDFGRLILESVAAQIGYGLAPNGTLFKLK